MTERDASEIFETSSPSVFPDHCGLLCADNYTLVCLYEVAIVRPLVDLFVRVAISVSVCLSRRTLCYATWLLSPFNKDGTFYYGGPSATLPRYVDAVRCLLLLLFFLIYARGVRENDENAEDRRY